MPRRTVVRAHRTPYITTPLAGVEIWSVPAATLGVPCILLIVWVALQAGGALAWIPAVKGLRGGEEPTR